MSAPIPHLIVLDFGTSSIRGTLVDGRAKVLHDARRSLPLISTGPGAAEQDPELYWSSCVELLAELAPYCGEALGGITLTNQQITTIPVDSDGDPLALAMLWCDQRPGDIVAALPQSTRDLVHHVVGMPVSSSWMMGRPLWWQRHAPEIDAAASMYLTVDAFIYSRLCGAVVTDPSNACFTLMNIRTDAYDVELAELLAFDLRRLPTIVPSGTIIGRLSKEIAAATGLPAGTTIIAGGSDQPCASAGMGVTNTDRVSVTSGTGTFVLRPLTEPIVDPRFMTNRGVGDVPYVAMGLHYVSGAAWNWFIEVVDTGGIGRSAMSQLLHQEVWARTHQRTAPLLIPYFSGARSPHFDDGARATWHGMTLSTTRADLSYSIMESNAIGVREIIDAIDDASGQKTEVVSLAGGPSHSAEWCQLQADASGMTSERAANPESSTIGAAMIALVGLGVYASMGEAAEYCLEPATRFLPAAETQTHYAARRLAARELRASTKGLTHV